MLFHAFGTQTRPASARSHSSSSSVKRSPSYLRVANLGEGFVVEWKCGLPHSTALPDSINVPNFRTRGNWWCIGHMRHRSCLQWHVVKVQDDRPHCVGLPGALDIPLCFFECGTARVVVRVINRIVYKEVLAKASGVSPYRVGHILLPQLPACPAHAVDSLTGAHTRLCLGASVL